MRKRVPCEDEFSKENLNHARLKAGELNIRVHYGYKFQVTHSNQFTTHKNNCYYVLPKLIIEPPKIAES